MSDTTPPATPETPAAAVPPPAEPVAAAAPAADPYAAPAAPYVAAPQPSYAPQYAVGPKTNTLAIVSLILSLVSISIGGVITGHIALKQIKERGEGGHGLALAGLIIGYVGSLGWILFWGSIILSIVIGGAGFLGLMGLSSQYDSDYYYG